MTEVSIPPLNTADCRQRRPRPSRFIAALMCIGLVLAVAGIGSSASAQGAGNSLDKSDDAGESSVTPPWGAAPAWPFRGVVFHTDSAAGYLGVEASRSGVPWGHGLGFIDTVTGEVSYVRAAGWPWFCRGGRMHADSEGIVWNYGEYGSDREWTVWVPWGDYGYPLFARPHSATWDWADLYRFVWPSRRGDRVQFGSGVADLPLAIGGTNAIGMATPKDSRFYLVTSDLEERLRQGRWWELPSLLRQGYDAAREAAGAEGLAPEDYFTDVDGTGPESWPWWPKMVPEDYWTSSSDDPDNERWHGLWFAGTDGQHYGITMSFDEPSCGPSLTYVVDASNGDVATCGWSWIGPLLVAPDDAVENAFVPALPDPRLGLDHSGQCRRDLSLELLSAALDTRDA